MPTLKPFADDAAAIAIGELKIENGQDRIALYGSLDLTRDKAGLRHARELAAVLADVVRVLEADTALPDAVAPAETPRTVKNPFS